MGHRDDGEQSSSRMWTEEKSIIFSFSMLLASFMAFSSHHCESAPGKLLHRWLNFDCFRSRSGGWWHNDSIWTADQAKVTLLIADGAVVVCSLTCTSILSVSNWWIVRFWTCCGRVDAPLIVWIFAPLMLLIVVLVSAVACIERTLLLTSQIKTKRRKFIFTSSHWASSSSALKAFHNFIARRHSLALVIGL